MIKLRAIWLILTNQYFITMSMEGTAYGCYPKKVEGFNMLKAITERLEEVKSKGDGT